MPSTNIPRTMVATENKNNLLRQEGLEKISANKSSATFPDMNKQQKFPRHELLGSRASDSNNSNHSWHNVLDLGEISWLAQHILLNQMIFPAAGYIAMAGETMRQLSKGNLRSYTLREFSVTSALPLKAGEQIEIFTKLRPMNKVEDGNEWYEIRITSFDGKDQVERCVGNICSNNPPSSEIGMISFSEEKVQRHVAPTYWYEVLASNGLKYGPAFHGLDDITASVTEHRAKATTSAFEDTSKYVLHPVTIEKCLQILMVAAYNGRSQQMKQLSILRRIKHLVVFSSRLTRLKIAGMGAKNRLGGFVGDLSAVSENGGPVLSINSCETSVTSDDSPGSENRLFSFIEWDTDPVYHNLNRLLAPFHSHLDFSILLERYTLLRLLDTKGSFGGPGQMHLQKIYDAVTSKKQEGFGLISDTSPFKELDDSTRKMLLQSLKTQIDGTTLEMLSTLVEQVLSSSEPRSESGAEREKLLDQCHPIVRNNGALAEALRMLGRKNPRLRILELGNGTDGTTRLVLDTLKSSYGECMYSTYTYSVTSLDAENRAKGTFKEARNIDVVYFDIEKQLQGQNLQAGSYDLIITTDFISPSRDVSACMACLRNLVHTNGRLFLLDIFQEPRWASLVKAHLSNWSPTSPTAFKDEKFIDQAHTKLQERGFVFGSENYGFSLAPKAVAELRRPPEHPKRITLVVPERHHPLINAIQMSFQKSGIKCDRCTIEGDIPQGQDIVSITDFGEPYLYNITETKFRDFISRLSNFKGSMIWVTPAAQISCKDPNPSMMLGLIRTLRAEAKKDVTTVEIDVEATTYLSSSRSILKIYQGLSHRPKPKDLDPDYEYAVVDGEIKIPRIHWTTREEELSSCIIKSPNGESSAPSLEATNASLPKLIHFRSDACYLLVGGLGGLGRLIATWMVENDARNILFLSRSAKEGPETTPFFEELRRKGCEVSTFAGSVTSLSDVEAAVKQATKPLAGVLQMSAVMRCVRPKVQGTWNLHQATALAKLDFFLLFSSICGMSGQWGQANYNAANSFLDAFVHYRHSQGLPASVADIGFMGEIGMAMENIALVEKLKASGYYFLGERDLIDALTIAINHSHPGKNRFMNKSQLGLGFGSARPITEPSTRVVWKKDARWAFSHHLGPFATITDDKALEYLRAAYQDQANGIRHN